MKALVKLAVLLTFALSATACKSSCDCFKHSYGQASHTQQNLTEHA